MRMNTDNYIPTPEDFDKVLKAPYDHDCDKLNCPSLSQHNLVQANKTITANGERMLDAVLNHAKPDYHHRFRERFQHGDKDSDWGGFLPTPDQVLAFIDEIVAEECTREFLNGHAVGVQNGRDTGNQETLIALIEKIERMKCRVRKSGPGKDLDTGYNQALDDLLTHLRAETCNTDPSNSNESGKVRTPQEETECCEKCDLDMTASTNRHWCKNKNCPCHKPRTEATKVCEVCQATWNMGSCTNKGCAYYSPITSEEKEDCTGCYKESKHGFDPQKWHTCGKSNV